MLPETPCTQFAHNLWKVVIINDKRDTPVNDILFLSASSIDKEFSQIYAHDEAFTYNLHKRIIRKTRLCYLYITMRNCLMKLLQAETAY